MAPTLANRKNTETKDTHAQPSSRATQGTIKGPQPWVAERTLKQRTHTRTPIKQSYAGATKGPRPWQAERALIQRTHTHAPSEATQGPSHGLNPGTQRNTETKDAHTHTHLKQSYTGATKWPQPWQGERTLKQRRHTHTHLKQS